MKQQETQLPTPSLGDIIIPDGALVDVVVDGHVGMVVLGERRPRGRDVTSAIVGIAVIYESVTQECNQFR